jgi:hypothetical protein
VEQRDTKRKAFINQAGHWLLSEKDVFFFSFSSSDSGNRVIFYSLFFHIEIQITTDSYTLINQFLFWGLCLCLGNMACFCLSHAWLIIVQQLRHTGRKRVFSLGGALISILKQSDLL